MPFINFFSTKQITNPIRKDGPDEHIIKKIGTPTMGGVLILLGLFSGVLIWCDLSNPYIWTLIFIVASFGLLGAYDDYKKIKFNNSTGVSFKFKIIIQIALAVNVDDDTRLIILGLLQFLFECRLPTKMTIILSTSQNNEKNQKKECDVAHSHGGNRCLETALGNFHSFN